MKHLKNKWKIAVFILLIIIAIIFVYSKSVDSNSPEKTIVQYFKYWNHRNLAGMNSLTIESMQLKDDKGDPLEGMRFVKLLECTERPDKGNWQEKWFHNPYEYVCVNVSFELHYPDEQDNRLQNWQYYLVKEAADSDWKIAMYGVG